MPSAIAQAIGLAFSDSELSLVGHSTSRSGPWPWVTPWRSSWPKSLTSACLSLLGLCALRSECAIDTRSLEFLAIDDHIGAMKVSRKELAEQAPLRDTAVFQRADAGYLEPSSCSTKASGGGGSWDFPRVRGRRLARICGGPSAQGWAVVCLHRACGLPRFLHT